MIRRRPPFSLSISSFSKFKNVTVEVDSEQGSRTSTNDESKHRNFIKILQGSTDIAMPLSQGPEGQEKVGLEQINTLTFQKEKAPKEEEYELKAQEVNTSQSEVKLEKKAVGDFGKKDEEAKHEVAMDGVEQNGQGKMKAKTAEKNIMQSKDKKKEQVLVVKKKKMSSSRRIEPERITPPRSKLYAERKNLRVDKTNADNNNALCQRGTNAEEDREYLIVQGMQIITKTPPMRTTKPKNNDFPSTLFTTSTGTLPKPIYKGCLGVTSEIAVLGKKEPSGTLALPSGVTKPFTNNETVATEEFNQNEKEKQADKEEGTYHDITQSESTITTVRPVGIETPRLSHLCHKRMLLMTTSIRTLPKQINMGCFLVKSKTVTWSRERYSNVGLDNSYGTKSRYAELLNNLCLDKKRNECFWYLYNNRGK